MQHPMPMVASLVALSVILCLRQVRESWLGWPVRIELWFLIRLRGRLHDAPRSWHRVSVLAHRHPTLIRDRGGCRLGAPAFRRNRTAAGRRCQARDRLPCRWRDAWLRRADCPARGRVAYGLNPRYPISTLIAALDPYSQAGLYLAFFSALLAVKKARETPTTAPSWQRSPSNLHGNSDWMPMSAARRRFQAGGIIIGEAYRSNRDPKVGGKAPLLHYDGEAGSGHCLVFAGSGGYKITGVGIRSTLEWSGTLVCLDPSAEVFPIVRAAREAWAIALFL